MMTLSDPRPLWPAPDSHPLFLSPVSAGFPSPADDFLEQPLDLNQYLIRHPAATFFTRVSGHSMTESGIHHGDLLVVDRSLEPRNGRVVIAAVNGDLTLKRLERRHGKLWLRPDNPAYPWIELTEADDCTIWGVVTYVIHPLP